MKWTIWISILLLCLTGIGEVQAQNDPVLAGMIAVYTEKAEKELKNQEKVMLMQTTGHIWTKEEVQATTDLQREFNNYLNSFRSIVCYAAQTYGFYYEVSRLTDNMGDFTKQLKRSPANTLAVALSTQRNKIYRELMMNSVEIVNDIRTACLSENKMTEKERMEIVFGIRPKLKTMNTKLQRLTKAVKYTTMGDIWREIDEGARPEADKRSIVDAAKRRWRQIGKNVRPLKCNDMGIWDSILKYGGKAAKATGRSMGHAALHPSQTLRGTGQAVKTAAIGGAVGYVGWEKLTTDKSVVHIVSDAVIGKSATDTLADAADGVRELTSKAGEAVGSVSGTVAGIDSKLGGVSNFLRQVSNGGVSDMFGNFFRNLGQGNVSGLSIAGLVAAAFLIFGRFGWLGKIAGAFLGMMLIGNNAGIFRTPDTRSIQRIQTPALPVEEQTNSGGMKR